MKKTTLSIFALAAMMAACNSGSKDATEGEKVEVASPEVEEIKDNTLTAAEKADGWKLLFDGTSLDGWRAFNGDTLPPNWIIEDGAMKGLGATGGADIGGDLVYGDDEFEEFELKFTWKISEGGNSGLFYHVVEGPDYKAPYYTGPEYQVIDQLGFAQPLEKWQSVGADYAMTEPDFEGAVKPAGEWNESKIVFSTEGSSYWLNGKKTVEFVPYSEEWNAKKNSGKWTDFPDYKIAKKGLIAVQDHGDAVWFKNIKIKKLK
ncbi:DUF1080 domain-containing protein [Echinicola sediminis]